MKMPFVASGSEIGMVLNAGLNLSVVDGGLKVAGNPATIRAILPLLKKHRKEIITRLQADGAAQNSPAMSKHGNTETRATQVIPAQQSETDAERLAAWERGEWVTIPHTAESLEIFRALELENMAQQIGMVEIAEELSKALAAIDHIDRYKRPEDFDYALSVLRSVADDAAVLLPVRAKKAA